MGARGDARKRGSSVIRRHACLVSVLVASLLVAVGCGGGDVLALDPVAAAATKTAQAGSFRVSYSAAMSIPNGPLKSFEFSGGGLFDSEAGSGRMSFQARLPADVQRALGGPLRGEMIFDTADGFVVYMRFPLLARELPRGKPWVKLDLQKLGKEQGVDFQTLLQAGQSDPSQMFDLLAESEAEKIGYDTVRGVATTWYRLDIDLNDALAGTPASERAGLKRMIEALGIETVPAEAWVDERGFLRRLKVQWAYQDPGSDERMTVTMTQEFYDFGVRVDVEPPPAGKVVDAAALDGVGT